MDNVKHDDDNALLQTKKSNIKYRENADDHNSGTHKNTKTACETNQEQKLSVYSQGAMSDKTKMENVKAHKTKAARMQAFFNRIKPSRLKRPPSASQEKSQNEDKAPINSTDKMGKDNKHEASVSAQSSDSDISYDKDEQAHSKTVRLGANCQLVHVPKPEKKRRKRNKSNATNKTATLASDNTYISAVCKESSPSRDSFTKSDVLNEYNQTVDIIEDIPNSMKMNVEPERDGEIFHATICQSIPKEILVCQNDEFIPTTDKIQVHKNSSYDIENEPSKLELKTDSLTLDLKTDSSNKELKTQPDVPSTDLLHQADACSEAIGAWQNVNEKCTPHSPPTVSTGQNKEPSSLEPKQEIESLFSRQIKPNLEDAESNIELSTSHSVGALLSADNGNNSRQSLGKSSSFKEGSERIENKTTNLGKFHSKQRPSSLKLREELIAWRKLHAKSKDIEIYVDEQTRPKLKAPVKPISTDSSNPPNVIANIQTDVMGNIIREPYMPTNSNHQNLPGKDDTEEEINVSMQKELKDSKTLHELEVVHFDTNPTHDDIEISSIGDDTSRSPSPYDVAENDTTLPLDDDISDSDQSNDDVSTPFRRGEDGVRLSFNISFAMESLRLGKGLTGVMTDRRSYSSFPYCEKMAPSRGAGWALVDVDGRRTTLSPMNLTIGGAKDSDVTIEGAEKSHAMLLYSAADDKYRIQDLDTTIGTYVNESRIPADIPVTLENMDEVTFGEGAMTYRVEQIIETAPEPPAPEAPAEMTSSRNDVIELSSLVSSSEISESSTSVIQNGVTSETHLHHSSNIMTSETTSSLTPRSLRRRTAGNNTASPAQQNTTQCDTHSVTSSSETEVTSPATPRDGHVIPSWATREHVGHNHHHLAECPGCIAEQDIKHTCSGHEDEDGSSSETGHTHHQHHHHHPTTQPPPPHFQPPHNMAGYSSYHNGGSPYQQQVQTKDDMVLDKDGASSHFNMYSTSSQMTSSSSHSVHNSSQQYGGSGAFNPVNQSTSKAPHETAHSQMKRSKSAHLEFEMSRSFRPAYPGSDPYSHYNRGGYGPPHPHQAHSGYGGHAFHPPPPHPGYYPPPPRGHHPHLPAYPPPYDSRGYPPAPTVPGRGCNTCAALIVQYGYVPEDHLMDHSLRQAQSPDEYREFPSVPPHHAVRHNPLYSNHRDQNLPPNPGANIPHSQTMPSLSSKLSMTSQRTSETSDTDQLNISQSSDLANLKQTNNLASSSGEKMSGEEDIIDDLDMTAFSGSQHQSVFTAPAPNASRDLRNSDINMSNQSVAIDNSYHNKTSAMVDNNSASTIPNTTTTNKTRELFARLDNRATNSLPMQPNGNHANNVLQSADPTNFSVSSESNIAATNNAVTVNKSSNQSASTEQHITATTVNTAIEAQPAASNNNHSVSIDENIPERDTNVTTASVLNNTGNKSTIDNGVSTNVVRPRSITFDSLDTQDKDKLRVSPGDSSYASGESPNLPRKDQRRNVMEGSSELETVKKSTPLYGQPAWWGEQQRNGGSAIDDNITGHQAANSMDILLSNSSLATVPGNQDPTHTPPERDTGPMNPVTMTSVSEPAPKVPEPTQKPETAPTAATASEETAPLTRRGSNMAFTIDFGSEKKEDESSTSGGGGPTAFTVDFGDTVEKKPKKLSMDGSLSQFLPTKVRQGFRSRVSKSKKSEDEEGQDESESSQLSDSNSRQWQSPATPRKSSLKQTTPKLARKTGYLSDGAHSAMSSDNEDLSFRSDVVSNRSTRKPTSTRKSKPAKNEVSFSIMSPEKPGGNKSYSSNVTSLRSRPISASDSKVMRCARVLETISAEKKLVLRSKSAGITLSSNKTLHRESSFDESNSHNSINPPTETELYQEAKIYDNIIKSKSEHTIEPKKSPESRPTRRSRNKKESYMRSRSVPRVLPVPDNVDNVSEAGTYTIDIDNSDFHKARRSIDAIFNVPGRKAVQASRARVQAQNIQNALKQTTRNFPVSNSTDINANVHSSSKHSEVVQQGGRTYLQETSQTGDVHIEISVDAPTGNRSLHDAELDKKLSGTVDAENDSIFQSARSAFSASSKNRRKLPSPPGSKNSSAEPSPRSPRVNSLDSSLREHLSDLEIDPDTPNRQRGSVTIDDGDSGSCFTVSYDAPQSTTPEMRNTSRKPVRSDAFAEDFFGVSSPPRTTERRSRNKPTTASTTAKLTAKNLRALPVDNDGLNGYARGDDLSGDDTPRYEGAGIDTARSIDTNVLLQDTDQVMKALEQRNATKKHSTKNLKSKTPDFNVFDFENFSSNKRSEDLKLAIDQLSNSDASSTSGLIDEHNPSVKPPRKADNSRYKPVGTHDRVKRRSHKNSLGDYGTSDGHESEDTGSITSSSTDYSHGNRTGASPMGGRQNSIDKSGKISNTRTNRAFALRRSNKDDANTSIDTPSTVKSSTRSKSDKDTARTEVSLGTKIVKKSRENQGKLKREDTFTRKDGGRYSLRAQKPLPVSSTSSAKKPNLNVKPTADLSRPRAGRANSVNTTSSKTSTPKPSQPQCGKKAEELDAFKRRTKYDPRKAVKEAKAREQEEKRQKRARSAGHTPEFDALCDSASEDSFALGAESLNMSGIEGEDEITKLSSTIASDMSILTASAQQEDTEEFSQEVSFRSSAFTSVNSARIGGSVFSSPTKNVAANGGLLNPHPIKGATSGRTPEIESYDPVLVSSIHQISQQIKAQTETMLIKLKEEGIDNPLDDLAMSHSVNPELAATLQNLKAIEHSLKVFNSSLFPVSGGSSPRDPEIHQLEMDRIRNELAGFKPIASTKSTPSLLSSVSKETKLSVTSKRDSKYNATSSMTSLTKTGSSKTKSSFSRTSSKDMKRYPGQEYF